MKKKLIIAFFALLVLALYGFIGTETGSESVSKHPDVSVICQYVIKLPCSAMTMPPGGVDCGGEMDRLKAEAQSKVEKISVGLGVFAKRVKIETQTISRQRQQVEVTCRGLAVDPLWPVNKVLSWFEVKRP